jgi:hypothetical protein
MPTSPANLSVTEETESAVASPLYHRFLLSDNPSLTVLVTEVLIGYSVQAIDNWPIKTYHTDDGDRIIPAQ